MDRLPENFGGISSVGQSTCLARRGSRVRLPYSPQQPSGASAKEGFSFYNLFVLLSGYKHDTLFPRASLLNNKYKILQVELCIFHHLCC